MKLVKVKQRKADMSQVFKDCRRRTKTAHKDIQDCAGTMTALKKNCKGLTLQEAEEINMDLQQLLNDAESVCSTIKEVMKTVAKEG